MTIQTTDHTECDRIALAAEWLAATPRDEIPGPIVPTMRGLFDLTMSQAIEAVSEAGRLRRAAGSVS